MNTQLSRRGRCIVYGTCFLRVSLKFALGLFKVNKALVCIKSTLYSGIYA